MIRHIVALRLRAEVTEAEKQQIYHDLAALRGHLEGMVDFRSFPNLSPESVVVQGFHDLFWCDFRDAAARDTYLADPAHQAIGARLVAAAEGGVAGILVLDVAL